MKKNFQFLVFNFQRGSRGEHGFTIIEALVAVGILSTVVIGALGTVQSSLSSYIFSKDQIVAFYLAQEGFEALRNIRDENRLKGQNWLQGISLSSGDPCYFGQACTVSPAESTVATRCSGPCSKLRQDSATGFFGYNSSWPETVFRREIRLESRNSAEIAVIVSVTWSKGSVSREFKARENLLDW